MTDHMKQWPEIAAKLRRALGLAPPTPEEADAEMAQAEEAPMTEEEIDRIVNAATSGTGCPIDEELEVDYSWLNSVETETVSEEMLVLNRNAGEEDPEVKKRLEDLRKKALEDDDEEDEA